MKYYRTEKTGDFTMISNSFIRDKQLSFKAKGVMILILSLPDSWNLSVKGLTAFAKEGRDTVIAAIHELEAAGYIERREVRDKKGRFRTVGYTVYENGRKPTIPDHKEDAVPPSGRDPPDTDFPESDFPESVFPDTDFPT